MTSSLWSYFLSCQMRVLNYLYLPRHIHDLPALESSGYFKHSDPWVLLPHAICKRNKWWCLIQLQLPYKYHILGGLNSRCLCISHSSEAGKVQECAHSVVPFSSYNGNSPNKLESHPRSSFSLNVYLKGLVSKYSHMEG